MSSVWSCLPAIMDILLNKVVLFKVCQPGALCELQCASYHLCWQCVLFYCVVTTNIGSNNFNCCLRHLHCFLQSSLAGFQNSTVSLLIHSSARNYLTICHSLSVTSCCIRIYRAGRKLSSFKLFCNLFGINPIVGNTSCRPFSVPIFL
jgi:hypothetical protein